MVNTMVNGKKVIISICVIMMVIGFGVKYSYLQERPSEDIIKDLIKKMEINKGIEKSHVRNIFFTYFNITNSSFNNKNRYCIIVNYQINYEYIKHKTLNGYGFLTGKKELILNIVLKKRIISGMVT
jgi:hypothetical protein